MSNEGERKGGPGGDWQRELRDSLSRAGEALARGLGPELARAAGEIRSAIEEAQASHHAHQERQQRRMDRRRRRLEEKLARRKRHGHRREPTPAEARTYAAIALVFVILTFTTGLWWMAFIAAAFGIKAAKLNVAVQQQASAAQQKEPAAAEPREEAPEPRVPEAAAAPAAPRDPRDERIDSVCNRLLDELRLAPDRVREFLGHSAETVEALRRTCHELLRRERALRAAAAPEEQARLEREHAALSQRVAAETDDVSRERLRSALAALQEQRAHVAVLQRNANRLEAEQTRLVWTLESLHAQIFRMRNADAGSADAAGAGVQTSLGQLRDEVNALADALEQVNADVRRPPRAELFEGPATGGDLGGGAEKGRVRE